MWERCRAQGYLLSSRSALEVGIQLMVHILQDREAVFPTRQSLGLMKTKLKGAETGHSLLKRKSEALTKYVCFAHSEVKLTFTVPDAFEVAQLNTWKYRRC